MNHRRIVLRSLSGAAIATAAVSLGIPLQAVAQAASGPKLDENDPTGVALGYRHDTTKVDQAKFPKHEVSQVCSGCQLYQGTAKDAWAPCTLFSGKQVAAKGWCASYVKKAA